MHTHELAAALRAITPQVARVAGCYLLVRADADPPQAAVVQQMLAHSGGDRRRAERDMNRCFIVANLLDHLVEERAGWSTADLLTLAETYAALLRDALQRAFPAAGFVVEIVGAALVDDEPLELCVTFSHLD